MSSLLTRRKHAHECVFWDGSTGVNLLPFELLDGSGVSIAQGAVGKEKFQPYKIPAEPDNLKGSESCAYVRRDDKVDVTYTAPPIDGMKVFLVVKSDGDSALIYEKEVPASASPKMATWPLTKTDGSALEVGEVNGQKYPTSKKFKLSIEIRKEAVVTVSSGYLPVYVDDHLLRNQQFIATKGTYTTSPIAEMTWTAVLHAASKAVVNTVEKNTIAKVSTEDFRMDNAFAVHQGNKIIIQGVLDQIKHPGSAWEGAVSKSWGLQNNAMAYFLIPGTNPMVGVGKFVSAIDTGWQSFEGVENRLRADGYIEFGIMSEHDAGILKREITEAARDPSLNDGYLVPLPKAIRTKVQDFLVTVVSKSRLDKNFEASKVMASEAGK